MPGPSIATASVTVDLDGRRLPAEAKALGEETGREMGDAHGKAFNERTETYFGDLRDSVEQEMRDTGKLAGDGSGEEFGKAFDARVRADASRLNHDLADIFADTHGLDRFHTSLGQSGDELQNIKGTVSKIDDMLLQAADNGSLNESLMTRLSDEAHAWAEETKGGVNEYRDLQGMRLDQVLNDLGAAKDEARLMEDSFRSINEDRLNGALDNLAAMKDEARRVEESFHAINEERLNNVLDDLKSSRDESERLKNAFRDVGAEIDNLRHDHVFGLTTDLANMFEQKGGLETYRRSLQDVKGEFVPVQEAAKIAAAKLGEYESAMGRSDSVSTHFRGELEKFAKTAGSDVLDVTGKMVRGVEDLGNAAGGNSGKVDSLTKSAGGLIGKLAASAGAGNLAALIALLIGLAGPAAVLLSALAAQTVILGVVAGAGAVGVGALMLAFTGLFGKTAVVPASLRPVVESMKDIQGAAKGLRTTLQEATFKGLTGDFNQLAAVMPKLGTGVTAIGQGLGVFLDHTADAVIKNIGPINDLLKGFKPIIADLGDTVLNLAGVFGGLFKAAMPFAQTFASSLEDTTGKWSDWLNSINGQHALQKWFQDAQPVMDHVMKLLGSAGTAFSKLVTPQTSADVLTVLDNIGTLLVSLSSIAASLSPATTAATTILALAGQVLDTLSPIFNGVGVLAEGIVAILSPLIGFLDSILGPVFGVLGHIVETIGNLVGALAPIYVGYFGGMTAAVKPVIAAITGLYNGFLNFINRGIKIAGPAIKEIGTILQLVGTSIGDFLSGLVGAGKQTTAFGLVTKASGTILDNFKGFIAGVTGYLKQIAGVIQNQVIPAIKEMDWKKVTDGFNKIISIIPDVIDYFGSMIGAIGKVIGAIGAWVRVVGSAATDIMTNFHNVANVIHDVATGNFAQAAVDMKKAMDDAGSNGKKFQSDLSSALKKTGDAADALGKAHQKMQKDIGDATLKATAAIKDFQQAGDSNLGALSKRLGITGTASTDFRAVVVDAAKRAGVSLKDVADAKSLPDLETKLGLTGTAAKTKFANEVIAAMNSSKTSIGSVPPEIQKLIDKYGTIPKNKNTTVTLSGADTAVGQANAVGSALAALHDKRINITQIVSQIGDPGKLGHTAIGGIMAGGQLIAGGMAFADGGILSSPSWFGNVLAGEAGMEAIVPLSKPLSQVDPSVRNLSAYAQGMGATTNKDKSTGAYVAAGAIVVNTPAVDGSIVAEQVIDRLVPHL